MKLHCTVAQPRTLRLVNKTAHATILYVVLGFLVLSLSACQPDETNKVHGDTQISALTVMDANGDTLSFDQPVRSIVALSPHIVENIYVVGAQDTLVGVVEYSDFPPAAQLLPIVANFESTNIERILELNPDLIMAWESGNSHSALNKLRDLGFKVYMDRPDSLKGVAKSIRDIGTLTGKAVTAEKVASEYEIGLKALAQEYQNKPKLRTFYQVWNSPLQTISGNHIISAVIEMCGGTNIYAGHYAVAPVINIESVLELNPQAILASGVGTARPEWLDDWKQWSHLTAVEHDNLFFVDPNHIQRHTTRLLLGTQSVCTQLDQARLTLNLEND